MRGSFFRWEVIIRFLTDGGGGGGDSPLSLPVGKTLGELAGFR